MAQMVRVWRLRLLGGMGVSLIVPVMLLASLAVLALAGGFGGLTAIGQAFSGPPAPPAALTGARAGQQPPPLPARLVAALSAPAAPASAPGPPSAGAGTPAPTGSAPAGAPAPRASVGTPASVSRPAPAPGARQPTPQPVPQPPPTVVDNVVGTGSSVTQQLPAPVGSTATRTLKTAGATLDSIVPIKTP